jgi:hypothetical protein
MNASHVAIFVFQAASGEPRSSFPITFSLVGRTEAQGETGLVFVVTGNASARACRCWAHPCARLDLDAEKPVFGFGSTEDG